MHARTRIIGIWLLCELFVLMARGVRAQQIYIADGAWDAEDCRIIRIGDMSGKDWEDFGQKEFNTNRKGAFGAPTGLCVDSKGRIYVADAENGHLIRMDDMEGKNWTVYTGKLFNPSDVFVDAKYRIYITEDSPEMGKKTSRLVRIDDMTGKNRKVFDLLEEPTGVCVDKVGHIYIVNYQGCRITRIDDMDGKHFKEFGTKGSGKGQFHLPYKICVDARDRLYVSDFGNRRIVRIDDITGKGWTTFGRHGHGKGQFENPGGIGVDAKGRIYVTDGENGRIVRIDDMTGKGWTTFGTKGTKKAQFNNAHSLFVH